MAWVRLDDRFPEHPKVTRLSDAAFRLHVSAICYSNRQETDGVIPEAQAALLVRTRKLRALINELVASGLWEVDHLGWRIHDYLEYQPSRADQQAMRKARAAAGQIGGFRSGVARRSKGEAKPNQVASSPLEANANPRTRTRPVPQGTTSKEAPTRVGADSSDLGDVVADVISAYVGARRENGSERFLDPKSKQILAGQVSRFLLAGCDLDLVRRAVRDFASGGHNPAFFAEWLRKTQCGVLEEQHDERKAIAARESVGGLRRLGDALRAAGMPSVTT